MFNKLKIPEEWREYYSKYPNGLTILEALIQWASQVDSMVDVMNNWTTYLDNFVAQFEFDLQIKVTETLNAWYISGFLETIITAAIGNQFETLETQINDAVNDLETKIKESNLLNVKAYGALGDGVTDDTDAINAVIQLVKANNLSGIYFPPGTYLIDGNDPLDLVYYYDLGGLFIDFPTRLVLHPNAILKAKTSDKIGYAIINIKNTQGVSVEGGQIVGERTTHIGVLGEFGFGITVRNSKNITLRNIQIRDFWGDGIIVGSQDGYVLTYSENIVIDNVVVKNNRRQGLSVLSTKNLFVTNSEFSLSNGTDPMCGIDIEANPGYPDNENIFIKNCVFKSNTKHGLIISTRVKNVIIEGNSFENCNLGVASGSTTYQVKLLNNIIDLTAPLSIYSNNGIYCSGTNVDLVIRGNTIKNAKAVGATAIGLETQTGVLIQENKLINNHFGILLEGASSKYLSIIGNIIQQTTDYGIYPYAQLLESVILNNILNTIGGDGILLRMQKCQLNNNLISEVQRSGMYNNPVSCVIENNTFINNGKSSYASANPSIGLLNDPTDNFIFGNIVRNTIVGHVAIRNEGIPTKPNVVSKNNFRIGTAGTVIVLHASDINDGNFTL